MVFLIRDPVAFGGKPEIVHESRRGPTRQSVRGEVPHAHGDGMILIEVFHIEEPEKLVGNKGASQRAAELFTGKTRRGLPTIESRGEPLQRLVAEEKVLRSVHIVGP